MLGGRIQQDFLATYDLTVWSRNSDVTYQILYKDVKGLISQNFYTGFDSKESSPAWLLKVAANLVTSSGSRWGIKVSGFQKVVIRL